MVDQSSSALTRLPMGVLAFEVGLREGLVDDHDRRAAGDVGLLEPAAGHEVHPHRRQVARVADLVLDDRRVGVALLPALALDLDVAVGVVAVERQVVDDADRLDARHRRALLEEAGIEAGDRGVVLVARGRQRELRGDHAARIEADLETGQAHEAAQEQAGADEQGERQRHLGAHQDAAEDVAVADERAPALAQRRRQVGLRGAQRRHQPEDERAAEGDGEGEDQRAGVHVERDHRRDAGDRAQDVDAPRGQQRPEGAGDHRQDEALEHELADDAAAAGAERGAHGDLVAARGAAREQQVGDVGAGDEEDEHDRDHEHDQRRAHRRGVRLVEREHLDAAALLLLGVGLLEARGDGDHVGLRLVEAGVALHAGVDLQVVAAALRARDERLHDVGVASGGTRKPGGRTPMMVTPTPFRLTERPTISGSPPQRRCQRPWLISATESRPEANSSAAKARPATGWAPKRGTKSAVTFSDWRRSGSPVPEMVTPPVRSAVSCSSVEVCSRQSAKLGPETAPVNWLVFPRRARCDPGRGTAAGAATPKRGR
jgi:hypothetical protein